MLPPLKHQNQTWQWISETTRMGHDRTQEARLPNKMSIFYAQLVGSQSVFRSISSLVKILENCAHGRFSPSSKLSRFSMSSELISKSNNSVFETIRSLDADLGRGTYPYAVSAQI